MKNKNYSLELKYTISNARASHVLSWLKINCIPDYEFPEATVSSIYYDTRDLQFLQEKINSDYLKTKIRIRWYSDLSYTIHYNSTFVEAKFKIGSKRHKIRKKTSYTGEYFSKKELESQELITLPYILHEENYHPPRIVFPAFQISYKRSRFIEPFTRSRICLDYDIRSPKVNSFMRLKSDPTPLPTAVFEIKGYEEELPASLYPLTDLGLRKESFSKYSACYSHIMKINY